MFIHIIFGLVDRALVGVPSVISNIILKPALASPARTSLAYSDFCHNGSRADIYGVVNLLREILAVASAS